MNKLIPVLKKVESVVNSKIHLPSWILAPHWISQLLCAFSMYPSMVNNPFLSFLLKFSSTSPATTHLLWKPDKTSLLPINFQNVVFSISVHPFINPVLSELRLHPYAVCYLLICMTHYTLCLPKQKQPHSSRNPNSQHREGNVRGSITLVN